MAAKRTAARSPAGTRKAARKTAAGGSAAGGEAKGLPGKASRGKEMTLDLGPQAAAAMAMVERKESRPYTTRYPIPDEQFYRLKASAEKAKARKSAMTASADTPSRKAEMASLMEAPALAAAESEPSMAPSPGTNFAGISATGWIPPDCTMAVGPSHVLTSVNSSVAIYNKAGGAAVLQRTLTQWFANVVQGQTIFDPKALYDQHAARWVLLAVAFKTNPNKSLFLLSVSVSSNPLGAWRNYSFDATVDGSTPTNNWADFPGLGVDAQALYFTANMFAFGGGFQYAKIRVVPKAGPYSGGAAPFWDFVKMKNPDNTFSFTIQPCHTFGAPQVEYLVNSLFPGGSSLTLWKIANLPNPPVLSRTAVPTAAYALPPNADQSGGPAPLNTGDVRVQHAVFRGDSVWTAVTTVHDWGLGNRASIQWFQVRAAASALIQQGVFGTRASHYFYPAGCPDNNGNFTLVFSRAGAGEFASIGYTGRKATDPLGTLQASALLKAGVAHYQALDGSGRNRWGDYNGVASDPVNARVVWFSSEFASAVNTWATWVGSAFF